MNEETVHRMKQMKLLGMAAAFRASFEQEQMVKSAQTTFTAISALDDEIHAG